MAGYAWGRATGRNDFRQPDKSTCIDTVVVGARFSGIVHWALSECPPPAKRRSMFFAENITESHDAIYGQVGLPCFETLPLLFSHIDCATKRNWFLRDRPRKQDSSRATLATSVEQARWSICRQYLSSTTYPDIKRGAFAKIRKHSPRVSTLKVR